ncbi:MAG: response regulator [Bacteroidia bacterium]
MKTKVFITDDHPLVVEGLKNILENEANIEVVGLSNTGRETVLLVQKTKPDILFLDINLPDISGIEVCRQLQQSQPKVKCIALSTFNDNSYVSRMLSAGAKGYLLKNSEKKDIINCINKVMQSETFVNVHFSNTGKNDAELFVTRREKEVLSLIAEGLTNNDIAEQLNLSVTTVNTHRKNLLFKFKVNNTASLVMQATKAGVL